jgi:hypothetical protein
MHEIDISDEDLPPRVRAAEQRRRMREAIERSSLGAPGARACIKISRWELKVPGAEEPTAEDYRLADAEIAEVGEEMRR